MFEFCADGGGRVERKLIIFIFFISILFSFQQKQECIAEIRRGHRAVVVDKQLDLSELEFNQVQFCKQVENDFLRNSKKCAANELDD